MPYRLYRRSADTNLTRFEQSDGLSLLKLSINLRHSVHLQDNSMLCAETKSCCMVHIIREVTEAELQANSMWKYLVSSSQERRFCGLFFKLFGPYTVTSAGLSYFRKHTLLFFLSCFCQSLVFHLPRSLCWLLLLLIPPLTISCPVMHTTYVLIYSDVCSLRMQPFPGAKRGTVSFAPIGSESPYRQWALVFTQFHSGFDWLI